MMRGDEQTLAPGRGRRAGALCLAISLIAGSAAAETAHEAPASAISFEEAIGGGLEALPELAGARAAAAATAKVRVPRPWSPLVLSVSPSLRMRPSEQRGLEGGVSVQQAIPLADVAGARRDHLRELAAQRAGEAAALRLETRLQAASTWIDAWTARARQDAAERDLELARSIVAITERGASAGVFTAAELADARTFAAEAALRKLDAEGAVADAGFALAAATGRPGRVSTEGPLPEPAVPAEAAWPVLVARAQALPKVTARRLAARADRARALEEKRSRSQQLVLGAELLRDGPGAAVAMLTLGITLPHDRGQREAGLALADAAQADGQADGLAARAAVDLARALHDVEHSAATLAQLERELIPAADDAAARRKRGFELGETTLVELLAAQRAALVAHARLSDAQASHAWARVHAWLLLQTSEGSR